MADGLCAESKDCGKNKLKTAFVITSAANMDVSNTNNVVNSEQPKLCVNGESGDDECSKFGVDSVVCVSSSCNSGSGESNSPFTTEFKNLCQDNDDNCRKKRCADRYDSSESSDRLVFHFVLKTTGFLCSCDGLGVA